MLDVLARELEAKIALGGGGGRLGGGGGRLGGGGGRS